MPIYEYTCSKCQCEYEFLVRGRSDKVICPECGSGRARKRFSVFGMKSGGSSASSGKSSSCSSCSATSCKSCGH